MSLSQRRASPPKLLGRVAVAGMSLAVVALGTLAVWAAIVTQNGADGLSQAGLQTSGHLRAVQALSILDTSTDALETRIVPSELRRCAGRSGCSTTRSSRMETGEVQQARRIAAEARPMVQRLTRR